MNFDNKNILITGASRGIGQAIAKLFSEHGARTAVHYHTNASSAEKTIKLLKGNGHFIVQADLKDPSAVDKMIDHTISKFGTLDVLVNSAGIFEYHPVADTEYDDWQESWRRVIDTNLIGTANACYCASRHMIKNRMGHIVNISSRGAFRGEPEAPAYAVSKAGVNALTQSLAKYLGAYNVSVSAVAPGFVETDMAVELLSGPEGDGIRNQSSMGRVAKPEEVAYAVLFLASKKAQFCTGAIIDVNGASYLRT